MKICYSTLTRPFCFINNYLINTHLIWNDNNNKIIFQQINIYIGHVSPKGMIIYQIGIIYWLFYINSNVTTYSSRVYNLFIDITIFFIAWPTIPIYMKTSQGEGQVYDVRIAYHATSHSRARVGALSCVSGHLWENETDLWRA